MQRVSNCPEPSTCAECIGNLCRASIIVACAAVVTPVAAVTADGDLPTIGTRAQHTGRCRNHNLTEKLSPEPRPLEPLKHAGL